MITANIHAAKTNLSRLIERAVAGEEVVIARNGAPVVRLQPIAHPDGSEMRNLGALTWAEWKMLDQEVQAAFEAAIAAPGPSPEDRAPDPSPTELERLSTLPTEDLVRELASKP